MLEDLPGPGDDEDEGGGCCVFLVTHRLVTVCPRTKRYWRRRTDAVR